MNQIYCNILTYAEFTDIVKSHYDKEEYNVADYIEYHYDENTVPFLYFNINTKERSKSKDFKDDMEDMKDNMIEFVKEGEYDPHRDSMLIEMILWDLVKRGCISEGNYLLLNK
jgi:hypothetical protein